MLIAIVGCLHGELDVLYENIRTTEEKEGVKIDLLICCGDFQATRNLQDLRCMAVPLKYQDMCSFYKYYSGEKVAPVLTIFVGGNHEASNYLQELPYGGWVAPNIFYLGYAGVVNYGGLRIGGISGIYKGADYLKGHFEKPPYSEQTKRSVYHVRNLEVFRMKQLSSPLDIMISHDWPKGIWEHGNKNQLLKHKPFFRDDMDSNQLGSDACQELLNHLKPTYWLAAHLHTKFVALVPHIEKEDSSEEKAEPIKSTRFLALDKCLKKKRYLQLLEVASDESKPKVLEYDLEWLAILFLTNHLLSVEKSYQYMPGPCQTERWIYTPSKEEMELVSQKFKGDLAVPNNFVRTAAPYSGENRSSTPQKSSLCPINPQTTSFCSKLCVDDPLAKLAGNDSPSLYLTPSDSPYSMPNVSSPVTDPPSSCLSLPKPKCDDSPSSYFNFPKPKYDDTPSSCFSSPTPKSDDSPMPRLSLPKPKYDDSQASFTDNSDLFETVITDGSQSVSTDLSLSNLDSQEPISNSQGDTSSEQSSVISATQVDSSTVPEDQPLKSETPRDEESEPNNPSPTKKKFKRRNQSLYTNSDDTSP